MRYISRIGDVFYVTSDDKRRFFQFIGRDLTGLNSDVIRVFNKWYPLNDNVEIETILSDTVLFYTHTYVTYGQKTGFWAKYGHAAEVGTAEILFKGSPGCSFYADPEKVTPWRIWKMNERLTIVDTLPEAFKNSDFGTLFTPDVVVRRILTGEFPY